MAISSCIVLQEVRTSEQSHLVRRSVNTARRHARWGQVLMYADSCALTEGSGEEVVARFAQMILYVGMY